MDLLPNEQNFYLDKSIDKNFITDFFRKRYQFSVRILIKKKGYIIRTLQHFATKPRNITNFVMLFQVVMKWVHWSEDLSWGS